MSHSLTPMMQQYRSIKDSLDADTVLFFRLGDFYEMFFEDAVRASDILNITLTGRDAGEAGRIPMCGIPYHAFQGYVRTLLEAQLKVALCEQVGDPKKTKGLVERRVTRVITPSTYLDDETATKTPEYIVAVVPFQDRIAIAQLEPSTGNFSARELKAERLLSEISLLAPRELVLPESLKKQETLIRFAKETLRATLTHYEDWVFTLEEAQQQLRRVFGSGSLEVQDAPLAARAAGAILYYLRDHMHESMTHIRPPQLVRSDDHMILDRQTQRSLELVASINNERQHTLLAALDFTQTSMGSRTLYQWVTHPLLSIDGIRERQQALKVFVNQSEFLQRVQDSLQGLRDIERTLSRLNYGVANARDLINLKLFLERLPQLKKILSAADSAMLTGSHDALQPLPELVEEIDRAIAEDPPLTVREGGMIRPGYSEALDEISAVSKNGKQWLVEFQKREIERTGIRTLKIKYSQVFGYTIEISKANQNLVPEDYTRKQTLANAERFITPELKAWDEKISGAEEKIKALQYELFDRLRTRVLDHLQVLQPMARALGELDALQSLAHSARLYRWTCPDISPDAVLEIRDGRHPVVERMLGSGDFIPNSTHLNADAQQLAVLTGPNMAGKSTYIRQVALIVLLAQMGSFVPASSAHIGLCDRIFTRIGASDNLAGGESTFMVEMIETAHILNHATDRSLLVLDEVGRGTSTFDGVSLAWAICEHLASGPVQPRTLFATHYHELTQLADHSAKIHNLTMSVQETAGKVVFLRKVETGTSDKSYGIHVARLAGIPEAITRRAEAILRVLEKENTRATRDIESATRQLDLFAATPEPNHPVLERLRELNMDQLTPLEALNLLAELKTQTENTESSLL